MSKISVSIVLYDTDKRQLDVVIESCVNSSHPVDLYLIDNSPGDRLRYLQNDSRLHYLKSEINGGFGAGHNLAIKHFELLDKYDYHLVLNPDIEFDNSVIAYLQSHMNCNDDIGIIMPKIVNRDGTLQYARRLLPTPLDIFMKRFFPHSKRAMNYEMAAMEPKQAVEVVGLCGCFMFIRTSILKSIGLFDEHYFMYFEDFDLCRRASKAYKVIYYPNSMVIHDSNNEHRRNLKLFLYSIRAALNYFIKWGFFDRDRKAINNRVREQVKIASKAG
jgi:GT2 family glycosyltransferase